MSVRQPPISAEIAEHKFRRKGPQAPVISLDQPGRLRVAHLLALFSVSRATFYVRLNAGMYPKPDGHDGRFPFWKTSSVKAFLEA